MGPFFLRTLSQNSRQTLIRRLSPNLTQNFGQILTRALGLTTWSELHLEVVAPRFEEIYLVQGRQRGRQQTLAFRHRRRSPTELGYRRECPTYRPLPVLSLSLSIWSDSAYRDVANFLNLSDRVLVKQGCDEYSFTLGISEEVHETTAGKREGPGRSDFSLNS